MCLCRFRINCTCRYGDDKERFRPEVTSSFHEPANPAYCTVPAMPSSEPSPVSFSDDHIVVRGGHLKGSKVAALPVRKIAGMAFWIVKSHDAITSEFLTGIPAWKRPLCGMRVWKELRAKIILARTKTNMDTKLDEDEEENFDFGGEEVDDDDVVLETPMKKPRKRHDEVRLFSVDVQMPSHYGVANATQPITVLNSLKEIAIHADLAHMKWLMDYVNAELEDSD